MRGIVRTAKFTHVFDEAVSVTVEAPPKRFDKTAYMREYMRKRRAKAKEKP